MPTDPAEYLLRRRAEVRAIERRAAGIDAELTAALADPGAGGEINALHLAEWTEERRARLDAWVARTGLQLDHVEVELFVLAFAPSPPVWLVVWVEPVPWWRWLWPW